MEISENKIVKCTLFGIVMGAMAIFLIVPFFVPEAFVSFFFYILCTCLLYLLMAVYED